MGGSRRFAQRAVGENGGWRSALAIGWRRFRRRGRSQLEEGEWIHSQRKTVAVEMDDGVQLR